MKLPSGSTISGMFYVTQEGQPRWVDQLACGGHGTEKDGHGESEAAGAPPRGVEQLRCATFQVEADVDGDARPVDSGGRLGIDDAHTHRPARLRVYLLLPRVLRGRLFAGTAEHDRHGRAARD